MAEKKTAVEVFVPGQVVPKGRPRFSPQGRAYTPKRTKGFERKVALLAQRAMAGSPPMEGDVGVAIIAKSSKQGDLDNIIKSCLDPLNRIVYVDDKQVVKITAKLLREGMESVRIMVVELEEE